MEVLKKCFHCKNELPLSYFYKNKTTKDGLVVYVALKNVYVE